MRPAEWWFDHSNQFIEDAEGARRFVPLPAPTDLDVARLLAAVRRRIVRLVARHGIDLEDPSGEAQPTDGRLFDCPMYAEIQGAAVVGRVATGPRAGAAVQRLGRDRYAAEITAIGPLHAHLDGFDLHAAVAVPAGDRARLEHYRLPISDCGLRIVCNLEPVQVALADVARLMTKDELKRRTRRFALDVIRLVDSLPRTRTAEVVGRQLLRSATAVGANYRAACRVRSLADFVSKMGIVEEEADESMYWMELLVESACVSAAGVEALLQEANELLAITVSPIKTACLAKDRTKYAIKRLRNPKSAIRNALVSRLRRPAAVRGDDCDSGCAASTRCRGRERPATRIGTCTSS